MATPQLGKTGKFGDLKKRLTFLLLALVVFRIGAHIPVPASTRSGSPNCSSPNKEGFSACSTCSPAER